MTQKPLNTLTALAPMDGRYAATVDPLRDYFSEYGLIRYRVLVEIEWLLFLSRNDAIAECVRFDADTVQQLSGLAENFSMQDAARIKTIEKTTNHDVKAIEYFLRERLQELQTGDGNSRFIHFACTSEDINNLAYALAVRDARDRVILPLLQDLYSVLDKLADTHHDQAMLSRTHGQTASPTTMGKEIRNVAARLDRQLQQVAAVTVLGKKNGAVGNYNAHAAAYPDLDWPALGAQFVQHLGLQHNPYTTQIEPHDWMAELFHSLSRVNTVLLDWSRDVWGYISLGYFSQIAVPGEVGSSTMPHKINPIQFENAEGNLGLANALFDFLGAKLPVSRWQRDLSDSTVLRNIGVAMGWSMIAYTSILKGMQRLAVNAPAMQHDLNAAWEVLAEPLQTVMKRHGIEDAYEQLKEFSRGHVIDQRAIHEFINGLDIPAATRQELAALTPGNYTGYASVLARRLDK
ncbi:MAG: adenylosuccinate lyase [Gammaproteobacteria bacterium]|nr:adenylosuccinate lyase [Gammaproteobacteria bacterium]